MIFTRTHKATRFLKKRCHIEKVINCKKIPRRLFAFSCIVLWRPDITATFDVTRDLSIEVDLLTLLLTLNIFCTIFSTWFQFYDCNVELTFGCREACFSHGTFVVFRLSGKSGKQIFNNYRIPSYYWNIRSSLFLSNKFSYVFEMHL